MNDKKDNKLIVCNSGRCPVCDELLKDHYFNHVKDHVVLTRYGRHVQPCLIVWKWKNE